MDTATVSPYQEILKIQNEMEGVDADLQKQLAAGNAEGAEKDIEELQSLNINMFAVSKSVKFEGGTPLTPDLLDMQENLGAMLADVQKGQFSAAETLNVAVGGDLMDMYHIIV